MTTFAARRAYSASLCPDGAIHQPILSPSHSLPGDVEELPEGAAGYSHNVVRIQPSRSPQDAETSASDRNGGLTSTSQVANSEAGKFTSPSRPNAALALNISRPGYGSIDSNTTYALSE